MYLGSAFGRSRFHGDLLDEPSRRCEFTNKLFARRKRIPTGSCLVAGFTFDIPYAPQKLVPIVAAGEAMKSRSKGRALLVPSGQPISSILVRAAAASGT